MTPELPVIVSFADQIADLKRENAKLRQALIPVPDHMDLKDAAEWFTKYREGLEKLK